MKNLTALLLFAVTLPGMMATDCWAEDVADAARIDNKDAPIMDGVLDPIWKQAGQLRFPADAGNFYKFNSNSVMKLDGDVANGDSVYRSGVPFTIQEQLYKQTDPSTYTVYFLHDDINLYIAVVTEDDRFIEGSDYDQTSDGFGMGLKSRDGKILKYWLTWFRGKANEDTDPEPSGPPLDRERMCYDAEWRSKLNGTWNDSKDKDKGYVLEFYLPLETLGGYKAGDKIPANIFLIDHDSNPGGKFDAPKTNFIKMSWGSIEDISDLSVPRFIRLSGGEAFDSKTVGYTDIQNTLVAKSINPADAPKIDGDVNDPAWQSAYKLFFPSPIGKTWTMSKARYNDTDPSIYNVALLHDGTYLYVCVKSDDQLVESAPLDQTDVDQESDGLTSFVINLSERAQTATRKEVRLCTLWYQLDAWGSQLDQVLIGSGGRPNADHFRDIDHDGKKEELHFASGIPHSPYALDNDDLRMQWAYSPLLKNQWNSSVRGSGYSFEYRIPLKVLGLEPGERTRANIVITDHDGNPKKRYLEFKTRYESLWWGTDDKDLWKYDTSGKPLKMLDVPKEKERYIQLDASPGSGTKGYRGKISKYLNHFDEAAGFTVTENGNAKPSAVARGFSGNAVELKTSGAKPSSFSLTAPMEPFDLHTFAALEFAVQSSQEKLPLKVILKDATGKTAMVAERILDLKELAGSDYNWHKVVLPVAEITKKSAGIDLTRIQSVEIDFPETQNALIDELAAVSLDDILASTVEFIAGQQVPATGLIRSFAGTKPAHTYDQAVALLVLTDAGRAKEARLLANAMMELQEKSGDTGFFYDSYSAIDRRSGQGTDSGVGPNAWMAYALAIYGDKYKDANAKAAADRVCKWILATRDVFQKFPKKEKGKVIAFWEKMKFWDHPELDEDWEKRPASLFDPKTGGVWAAIQHAEEGAPTRPDIKDHNRDRMLFWYSTEGVIDAQHVFELMSSLGYEYGDTAKKIKDWMFRGGDNSGWNDAGYFNLGHNDFNGNDQRIYLDTHTWGSMLAKLQGQDDKALKALEKCQELISTRPFQGTQLRGFNDSLYPKNESIWFGGTAHYVAACNYLGVKNKADEFVSTLLKTQGLSGGWKHSSDFAYMTCFVRKSDGKVVYGYIDEKTGIAYDDLANIGNSAHLFKPEDYPEPEWTGYGTYHNVNDAVGETSWVYFALKGYLSGKPLPYLEIKK